jgi:hypothetical protein
MYSGRVVDEVGTSVECVFRSCLLSSDCSIGRVYRLVLVLLPALDDLEQVLAISCPGSPRDSWFITTAWPPSAGCGISSPCRGCRVFTPLSAFAAVASFLGRPFLGFVRAKTISSSMLVLSTPALCAREESWRIAVLETPVFASTSLWEALKMRNIINAAARFSSLYSVPRGMVQWWRCCGCSGSVV